MMMGIAAGETEREIVWLGMNAQVTAYSNGPHPLKMGTSLMVGIFCEIEGLAILTNTGVSDQCFSSKLQS